MLLAYREQFGSSIRLCRHKNPVFLVFIFYRRFLLSTVEILQPLSKLRSICNSARVNQFPNIILPIPALFFLFLFLLPRYVSVSFCMLHGKILQCFPLHHFHNTCLLKLNAFLSPSFVFSVNSFVCTVLRSCCFSVCRD